ncbi:MAG: hypothetical protein PHF60_05485 [Candidatus ainarchaeum sp.]|nr:hypothetical protein [Candidatus ainarchaeum sp.]
MGRTFSRFAGAFAISAAIHFGIMGAASQKCEENRFPSHSAMHEDIAGKKPDLGKLKEEKKRYLAELLESLEKGKEIKLSEFLIKSQVLDRNITLAEQGQPGVSLEDMQGRHLKLVELANARLVSGSKDQVRGLYEFAQEKPFVGYFWDSSSVLDILDTGWYNCLSSAQFFSALMEDVLGRKDYRVLLFDDHVALLIRGKRFEVQDHTWAGANMIFNGCGLAAPRDIFIAGYLLKNGVTMGRLPKHLASLYDVTISRKVCPESGKDIGDSELSGVYLPSPGVKSGLTVESYFMPNPRHKADVKQVVDTARVLFAAYELSRMKSGEITPIGKGGQDVSLGVTPIDIPADANLGEVAERYNVELASFVFESMWPKRITNCNVLYGIPPDMIPEMINALPPAAMRKHEYYTKDRICKRYAEAARNGTPKELDGYVASSFCHEVNSALKARYAAERDHQLVTMGMGVMALPENFDFFLEELESGRIPSDDIAYALVLSDWKKGCRKVMDLSRSMAIPHSLNRVCGRPDLAWKDVQESLSEPSHSPNSWQLEFLEGSTLTKDQYSLLKNIRNDDDVGIQLQLGRILYEYGDKETAFRRVRETAQKVLAAGETPRYLDLCGYPPEFYPILQPLMTLSPYATITMVQGLINSGMVKPMRGTDLAAQEATANDQISVRKLRDALRNVVSDEQTEFDRRVDAAFLLLRLKIDPLGKN